MTVGEKIKYFRKRMGLTQTQLANAAGLHPVSIRKYETNKTQPQLPQIEKIAAVMNISPNTLIGLENSNLRLETVGDFMSILYMLLDTNKISIDGKRSTDYALEPSTILLKIKDHFILENISNWEKTKYLYQKVLEQKDTLPQQAYEAAVKKMEDIKEKVALETEKSPIMLNPQGGGIAVKISPDISKYLK